MDDIVENIFTNSMKGGNILDLEVMKPISNIHGVKLFRPFLGFKKDTIFDFAHTYGVPNFNDTTPEWSKRGKMRNEIFPLLDNVFGTNWRDNVKYLGSQSNDWGHYINNYIIIPWIEQVKYDNTSINTNIIIPVKNQPKIIYNLILMTCLHECGHNMLKRTSVNKIMDLIENNTNSKKKYITLDNNRVAHLNTVNGIHYIVIELFGKNNIKV
jgi:tRNA(Ile)-lysidine synthase TilS/MesJ